MTFSNVKPKAILQLGKECILENETNISETKVLESILGLWEREREREREREHKHTKINLVWLGSLCPEQKALSNYIFAILNSLL